MSDVNILGRNKQIYEDYQTDWNYIYYLLVQ